jgi:hypothetical protein
MRSTSIGRISVSDGNAVAERSDCAAAKRIGATKDESTVRIFRSGGFREGFNGPASYIFYFARQLFSCMHPNAATIPSTMASGKPAPLTLPRFPLPNPAA